jgi:hypothetical protein
MSYNTFICHEILPHRIDILMILNLFLLILCHLKLQVHQIAGFAQQDAIGFSNINARVKMPPDPPKFILPPLRFTLFLVSVENMRSPQKRNCHLPKKKLVSPKKMVRI